MGSLPRYRTAGKGCIQSSPISNGPVTKSQKILLSFLGKEAEDFDDAKRIFAQSGIQWKAERLPDGTLTAAFYFL